MKRQAKWMCAAFVVFLVPLVGASGGAAHAAFDEPSAQLGQEVYLTCLTREPEPQPVGPSKHSCQIINPDGDVAAAAYSADPGLQVVKAIVDRPGEWRGAADNSWGASDTSTLIVNGAYEAASEHGSPAPGVLAGLGVLLFALVSRGRFL